MTNIDTSKIESTLNHVKVENDFPFDPIDPKLYEAIIDENIQMAISLTNLLTDQLELTNPISPLDLLDCLATLGFELNTIDEDISEYNWSSLAYMRLIQKSV